jgi:hypothetical protein
VGSIPAAGKADVECAVDVANVTFASGVWSKSSGAHRAAILRAIADKVPPKSSPNTGSRPSAPRTSLRSTMIGSYTDTGPISVSRNIYLCFTSFRDELFRLLA